MNYEVLLVRSAEREYRELSTQLQTRLAAAMLALAAEPYPRGCRKLSHGDGWRIRVGDYRIIYTVDEANKVVTVFALGHRRDIYRR